jgi:hypothetical protein
MASLDRTPGRGSVDRGLVLSDRRAVFLPYGPYPGLSIPYEAVKTISVERGPLRSARAVLTFDSDEPANFVTGKKSLKKLQKLINSAEGQTSESTT